MEIKENVGLAEKTSFRIGGPARYYAEVSSEQDLKEALSWAKQRPVAFYILGGGTNLLVSDKGFDGLIIRIKMNALGIEGEVMEVGAGVPFIKAVNSAASEGLSGLESFAGIPGTLGGAVRGNAGAYGSEIGAMVESVTAFDSSTGETRVFGREECDFSYRSSFFKKHPELIVLSAKLVLEKSDAGLVAAKTKETISKRVGKGLQGVKSAGSFFMNPEVKNQELLDKFARDNGAPSKNGKLPAGWIIDQAELRGKRIGGAEVSSEHANYLINADGATAEDVIMLASLVKQKVRTRFGVQLEQEVNYLGF